MRKARPVGLTQDGGALIIVTDTGETIEVPADERLHAAIRDDRPRLGQLEIDMEPTLRPREIQQRIRAGESLAEVAAAAGVPAERIEGFASPVIAEREHVAGLAADAPVRRTGETQTHRTLRDVVTERLLGRGVDTEGVSWDAWRNPDRLWSIRAAYESGSAHREALFHFDPTGRFSVAVNDDARWLVGEATASHGPQPGKSRRKGEADEPTLDLSDEMALVRAIQPGDEADLAVDEATLEETEDAYAEGELTEVDGVYDIVQPRQSNLDVLYDMLASFDEDSVQIYSGLISVPVEPVLTHPVVDEVVSAKPATRPSPPLVQTPPTVPSGRKPAPADPEQLSLLEPSEPAASEPPSVQDKPKKRRAHVPSWDEIVFGGPRGPKD
jgi:hypothetical protein